MKSIVITGATSMIGSAVLQSAIQSETEVWALVRRDTKRMDRIPESPLVHVLSYDGLNELHSIKNYPKKCDCFYHFAWIGTGKVTRDEPCLHAQNITYTLDAVEMAYKMGCRRFVGAGSQAEYGSVTGCIDENTPLLPENSYGISKYASSLLSRRRCEQLGLEHVWGRIFSVYGPHDKDWTMLSSTIDAVLCGSIPHFSNALQKWNYLYESDAGEMIFRLGQRATPAGEYSVAHPECKVLREYISQMMEELGIKEGYVFDSSAIQNTGLEVDVSRTIDAIHFCPKVSFEEGIRNTIEARCRLLAKNQATGRGYE